MTHSDQYDPVAANNTDDCFLTTRVADIGVTKDALLVPQRAIWEIQGNPQVAVVGAGNRISIRPIRTGAQAGGQVVVEAGLQPEDRVVVEGTQKVSEGLLVNPVAANPATGTPGK